MSEIVLVVMTSRYEKWQPGEVAGFNKKLADRLLKAGVAQLKDCGHGLGVVAPKDAPPAAAGAVAKPKKDEDTPGEKGAPRGAKNRGKPKGMSSK